MASTTGQFMNYLMETGKKLQTAMNNINKEAYWRQLCDVSNDPRIKFNIQDIENMGSASFWPENSVRPELTFREGYTQSWTQHSWGGMVDVSKALQKFDRYDLVDRLTDQLKRSLAKVKEIICMYYFEYGDTTSGLPTAGGVPIVNTTGGDGVSLFNATHGWKTGNGNTWSNLSSSSNTITETNLATEWTVVRRWLDNTGAPLNCFITDLVIPPDVQKDAWKVMESRLEPSSANNAINTAAKFLKGNIIEYPWLQNTADWYIKTDARDGALKFVFGWEDDVETGKINPNTGNQCISADFSIATGALVWRQFYAVK